VGNIIYAISLFLAIVWAICVFGFKDSGYIHILIVLSLLVLLTRVILGDRIKN
jgi:hypothetical protein